MKMSLVPGLLVIGDGDRSYCASLAGEGGSLGLTS